MVNHGARMSAASDAVAEFHRAYGGPQTIALRDALHAEEAEELEDALDELAKSPDCPDALESVARELADVVYVAYGTAYMLGIDLDVALTLVHRANMAKLSDCHTGRGKPRLRSNGKVLKPVDWRPPDLRDAISGGAG